MEANKHEWYAKLLVKLRKIEAGKLQLADYITEVERKLAVVEDFLQGHYMQREPEKKTIKVAIVGEGEHCSAMEKVILGRFEKESIPMQMVELPDVLQHIRRDMMVRLNEDIEKEVTFLIKSSPIIAEPLIYTGDLQIPSKRAQRRKKEREMKKRMRK